MDVSENSGFSPKSSILIGFSIINHPFWGTTIFGNTYMDPPFQDFSSPDLTPGTKPIPFLKAIRERPQGADSTATRRICGEFVDWFGVGGRF